MQGQYNNAKLLREKISNLLPIYPQAIQHHRNGAGGHGAGGDDGIQKSRHRERYGDDVIAKSPEEILADSFES